MVDRSTDSMDYGTEEGRHDQTHSVILEKEVQLSCGMNSYESKELLLGLTFKTVYARL